MCVTFQLSVLTRGLVLPWKSLNFSSSAYPAVSLGFTIFGEIFANVIVFNPAIEVVTFSLRGWYMLGVFLLECTCAQTTPQFIFSSEKVLGKRSQKPC